MKTILLWGAVALFAILLMMVPAVATTGPVTAAGTVIDARGQPVPGANVTLIDDNYHELGITTSDASGSFFFKNIELAGSPRVAVTIAFTNNGTTYNISLSDMRWYDASTGLVIFNMSETRFSRYPASDRGYAWGPILDSATNGKKVNGTVYLVNDTTTLTAGTSPDGVYQIEASPGDYEIYALRETGGQWFVSERTNITIEPSYSLHESEPQILIADIATTAPSPTPTPANNILTASGTVTDLQGNPLAGANVTLIDNNLRTLGTTTTDANGSFRIVTDSSGSDAVRAKISYVHAGVTYATSLENVRWYDASRDLLNFDPTDTRLYNYPPGNHGYVWGIVIDSITGGKAMDSTVYLKNNTKTLSTNTSVSGSGGFQFEVTPGDYTIYAVHDSGGNRLASNRTVIHVYQSNDLLLSAPITLIVDQNPSGKPVAVLPLAAALILGVLMVFGIWAILGRKR